MLEKKIQKGLEDLNFEQVQFEIHFAEKKEYSKDGIDDAEFRISLNQGQQVKPLTEVAFNEPGRKSETIGQDRIRR